MIAERVENTTWRGHGQVFKFSADEMRDAGLYVGPQRRISKRPKGIVIPQYIDDHTLDDVFIPGMEICEPPMDIMLALGLVPYEITDAGDNLLCNAGINRMESLLIAGGGQAYDNTHTAIGVGDGGGSVPTAAATDTDLTAIVNAANRYFQMADATYPSAATQVVTIQSTFATGNANFQWREWGVDQHTASGATASTAPLLNHKGVDLGAKTSAAAWAFKVTITIS